MTNFKYNQLEYAELVYKNGFQSRSKCRELNLLALYMRDILGYKLSQIEKELRSFCEKYLVGFNFAKDYKMVDKAVEHSKKKNKKLMVVEQIPIYCEEFTYITSLNIESVYKKVLFAFLVHMKLSAEMYFLRHNKTINTICFAGNEDRFKEIKQMGNYSNKLKLHEDIIYELNQAGLVQSTYKGRIQLLFLNQIPKITNQEPMFYIKNFNNAGLYFDYYCGEKCYKLCKECGEPFKTNSNSQEYCKEHMPLYSPVGTKTITCCDCGKGFEVDARNMTKTRCNECYKIHRAKNVKIAVAKYRNKLNS